MKRFSNPTGHSLSAAPNFPAIAALTCVLASCGSGSGGSGPGSAEPGGGGQALTYYTDIKPIVDQKCATCHYRGGIGPFPLETAEDVINYRTVIKPAIKSRTMPPWPPAKSCNQYVHDRSLSDQQVDTIVRWIDGGAKAGDPAAAAARSLAAPSGLSRVDLDLEMPVAYQPVEHPDDYRCFVVDWPKSDVSFVTGFGVVPGVPAIVHHVLAFVIPPSQVAVYEALERAETSPGYRCFGGPGGDVTRVAMLAAWAPGVVGHDFPSGTGIKVEPGSKIVLQVHYNLNTEGPRPDRTKVQVSVESHVDKEAKLMFWTNPAWPRQRMMEIPAGAKDLVKRWSFDLPSAISLLERMPVSPITVYGAGLHMHLHGTRARLDVLRQGRSPECMLDIEKWSFHWQGGYDFAQPKVLMPGDEVQIECSFDNSSDHQPSFNGRMLDPVDLNWGERTTDEMCLGSLYVTR